MASNEELSRSKVSLEMKALELEEQRDRWNEEKAELTAKVKIFGEKLQVRNCCCSVSLIIVVELLDNFKIDKPPIKAICFCRKRLDP